MNLSTRLAASYPGALAPAILLLLGMVLVLGAVGCGGNAVLSGQDLAPEKRGTLVGGRNVKLSSIDAQEVSASRVEVAPGFYTVQYAGRLQVERVNQMLAGAFKRLTCETMIEVGPGEEVRLSASWDIQQVYAKANSQWRESMAHAVLIERSGDEEPTAVSEKDCEVELDCRRLDNRRVSTNGCDRV